MVAQQYKSKYENQLNSKKAVKSQSLSKLLKLYTEGAHRTLSGKLFQQFTRRHERENARALFVSSHPGRGRLKCVPKVRNA